jgi:ABC-type nitrate/sulfonate/bicarbonate transport system substrate-binding protein
VALRLGLPVNGPSVAPLWVAKEEGIFLRYGIDAELLPVPGTERLAAAILSGDVPVGLMGAPAFVAATLGGADLVLLGSGANMSTFQLWGRPEIAAVRDLRGKQLAVVGRGGATRRFAQVVLERNGLDIDRDLNALAMAQITDNYVALVGGVVDAAVIGAPQLFQAEDEGLRLLADPSQYALYTMSQGITARRPWVAEHEAIVRGLLRAIAEGIAYAEQRKERTKEIMGQYAQTDDAVLLERTYDLLHDKWERTLRVPPEALQGDIAALADEVPAARDVRPEQLVDTRYVDEMTSEGFFARLGP